MDLSLPHFDDEHRALADNVKRLCAERLEPLGPTELEDKASAAIEYVALLGQAGLFDPALGGALEGDAPRPALRSLCAIRFLLGRTSGMCDGVYGAQVQGLYPIALCGNEDQRAILLPGMASGQTLTTLALLDGDAPLTVTARHGGYTLRGQKTLVAMAPIADRFVVMARHKALSSNDPPRFSLFVVEASRVRTAPEAFLSSLPVGSITFDDVEVTSDDRLGGEGQGLVIAQTSLDMLRLPTAAAALGVARASMFRGVDLLLRRGVGGRALREQQGLMWAIADALTQLEAAEALVLHAAYRRDVTTSRESKGTTMARQLAQDAAERACNLMSDLASVHGLLADDPSMRFLTEVRALRLESEFLENARTIVAQSFVATVEHGQRNKDAPPV